MLIPRPETEDWTLRLAQTFTPSRRNPVSVLDLCTGSGCIPLLLCHVWPSGSVHAYGVDISHDAIRLARDNAAVCDIFVAEDDNLDPSEKTASLARNTFRPILADIRDPNLLTIPAFRPPFNVITSNPPYIPLNEYEVLPPSVKDWEDPRALIGDPVEDSHQSGIEKGRGLTFYCTIARLLGNKNLLAPGGIVVLEVGEGQASDVASLLEEQSRLQDVEIWKDLWGKDRAVVARKPAV